MSTLDQLPVIIGAGQDMRPVPDDLFGAPYKIFGAVDLAARALERAFEDAGLSPQAVDVAFGVRLFGDSGPVFPNPFGGPNNFPASVCAKAGAEASRYVYGMIGGEGPQLHVGEAAQLFLSGEAETAVIVGAEAAANIRAAMRSDAQPDWREVRTEPMEDRLKPPVDLGEKISLGGYEFHKMEVAHRFLKPAPFYALMETARRAAFGETKEKYAERMQRIWQHFASVADYNPYAFVKQSVPKDQITKQSADNPMIVSPYTRAMVARDGVNLGAAILMSTYGFAKRMGISDDRLTFLHGQATGTEPPVINRARLDRSDMQRHVLETMGLGADVYDLYSCFPIVPLEAQRILGLDDDAVLTLTGGLPFFGGPGNNYSLHGIAEVHHAVRGTEKTAVVYANGGVSSKHAVGRYSGEAPDEVTLMPAQVADDPVRVEMGENPKGNIRTYTIEYRRGEPAGVVVIAQTDAGKRFYSRGDVALVDSFINDDPIGASITTNTQNGMNLITHL